MSRFNLDAIAGQAPSQEVEQAVRQARSLAWSDPESLHFEGKQAANLLEVSREAVAQAIGVSREHIAFTSSTADAIRAILKSVRPSSVLYSPIERKAVTDAIAESGLHATALTVGSDGHVDRQDLIEKLAAANADSGSDASHTRSPVAVFIQWANQEIGTVQELSTLFTLIHEAGAVLVIDATSALGYLPTSMVESQWDYLLADSASWGGSRVATTLASAEPAQFPDTTSVAEAATAAVTLESLLRGQPAQSERLTGLRNKVESLVVSQFEQADLIRPAGNRLPQVVTFSIPYVDAEALAVELDRQGVAIGSGSACASEVGVPSHVLAAIGRLTQGNVRVSLPSDCPDNAIDRLVELLPSAVERLTADLSSPPEAAADSGGVLVAELSTNIEIALELDERGRLCPHPVIELAKAAKRLKADAVIGITTDDPAALNDIPAWARLQNATVMSQESADESGSTRFVVQLS